MKSKEYRLLKKLTLVVFASIWAITISYAYTKTKTKEDVDKDSDYLQAVKNENKFKEKDSLKSTRENTRYDVAQRFGAAISAMKSNLDIETSKIEPGTEDDLHLEDLTGEELSELKKQAAIMEKISPIFMASGPKILSEMLEEEIRDSNSNSIYRRTLEQMLKDENFAGTNLEEIDCRETLCKTTMKHENEKSSKVFKELGAIVGPWSGQSFGKTEPSDDDSGQFETTVFFSKVRNDGEPFKKMNERMLALVEK